MIEAHGVGTPGPPETVARALEQVQTEAGRRPGSRIYPEHDGCDIHDAFDIIKLLVVAHDLHPLAMVNGAIEHPGEINRLDSADRADAVVESAGADYGERLATCAHVAYGPTNASDSTNIKATPPVAAHAAEDAADKAAPFLAEGLAVAVKVFSRDIRHKSDVGGVILGLRTRESVVEAARTVLARARSARPDASLQGVTIQPMIVRRAARELILGIADDPTFGPVIVFGRGGTAVEVIRDKALALPPLDMNLARDLVGRTRVARLLGAYRDVPAIPAEIMPLTLVKLAQMAADIPEVAELDINPLLADETGVLALDARAAIRKPARLFAGQTRLAVRPYPSQWEGELALRDGSRVLVRPMRPEDEPAVHRFLARVTAEDLRLRFFHAMKEFSHSFIARLTQLDYARAMAFVALDPKTGEMMGAVRLHSDSLYESGEYAILLQSDLKGKGLGWALMQLLIRYARSEGLKRLFGQVLAENSTMLSMCRDLGFTVTADPTDHSIVDVMLDLRLPSVDSIGADILVRPDRGQSGVTATTR